MNYTVVSSLAVPFPYAFEKPMTEHWLLHREEDDKWLLLNRWWGDDSVEDVLSSEEWEWLSAEEGWERILTYLNTEDYENNDHPYYLSWIVGVLILLADEALAKRAEVS